MLFSLHRSHIDSIHGLPYWALPELTFNEESQLRYHLKRGNSVLIGSARASSQAASTSFPLPANSQSVQRVDYKLYLYISLLGLDSVHKLCSVLMLCPGRAESKTKTGGGAPHPHHTTGVEGTVLRVTHDHGRRGWNTGPYIRIHFIYIIHIERNGVGQTKEQMYDSTCWYFPQSTGTLKACKHWLNLVCFLRVFAGTVWGWVRLPSFACENFFARWSTMATSRRKYSTGVSQPDLVQSS